MYMLAAGTESEPRAAAIAGLEVRQEQEGLW
jgi:hypothetical protein